MNSRNVRGNVRGNGTSFFRRTLIFRRKLMDITFSFRDKESSFSRLFIKMRESWWNATRGWLGCNRVMTKSRLLSSSLNRWGFAMRKSRVFCTITKISGRNWGRSSSSTIRSRENSRTLCASGPPLTPRNTPPTRLSPMESNRTPRDWFRELKNLRTSLLS